MWFCAQRSKMLPEGGNAAEIDFSEFDHKFRQAITAARGRGDTRIHFDDAARRLWRVRYSKLSEGKPGLLGAVTSRAEAQVVRLALLYAVLVV
jgi:hypothetical protein